MGYLQMWPPISYGLIGFRFLASLHQIELSVGQPAFLVPANLLHVEVTHITSINSKRDLHEWHM